MVRRCAAPSGVNLTLTAPPHPSRTPVRWTVRSMAMVGLREAARQAGVNKTTVLRAIQGGRLSAQKSEGGGYVIDPAELFRVYPPQPEPRTPEHQGAHECGGRDASPSEKHDAPDATEWQVRTARLEAQLEAAARERRLLEDALSEARAERDRWAQQAERLALTGPARRSWWPWQRSA